MPHTIIQRDVREMADIAGLTEMPRLLAFLAAQSGDLLNMAELSRDSGMSQPTITIVPFGDNKMWAVPVTAMFAAS